MVPSTTTAPTSAAASLSAPSAWPRVNPVPVISMAHLSSSSVHRRSVHLGAPKAARPLRIQRGSFATRAAVAGEVDAATAGNGAASRSLCELKSKLLRTVAGLDRGFAAGDDEVAQVVTDAAALEGATAPMTAEEITDACAGRWRLVYSSGFASGSLGGSRPGPPSVTTPVLLGQVFQVIRPSEARCDNIVTLRGPAFPFFDKPEVTVTLGHELEIVGERGMKITSDAATLEGVGPLPALSLPSLPEPLKQLGGDLRSATFDNTYVDGEVRVTRGDRGELRMYTRA